MRSRDFPGAPHHHQPQPSHTRTLTPTLHPLKKGTNYVETLRVQVHASCRLRRVFFADRAYSDDELPPEFKLYLPAAAAGGAGGVLTGAS